MAITDLPVLAMLRTRMQWNQARQSLVAENVANADMPGFRPRDLAEPRYDRTTGAAVASTASLAVTAPGHITVGGQGGVGADPRRVRDFEIRPSGNGVNLEDQMMKAGEIARDQNLNTGVVKAFHRMLMASTRSGQ